LPIEPVQFDVTPRVWRADSHPPGAVNGFDADR
jgi:hypothetical protein